MRMVQIKKDVEKMQEKKEVIKKKKTFIRIVSISALTFGTMLISLFLAYSIAVIYVLMNTVILLSANSSIINNSQLFVLFDMVKTFESLFLLSLLGLVLWILGIVAKRRVDNNG